MVHDLSHHHMIHTTLRKLCRESIDCQSGLSAIAQAVSTWRMNTALVAVNIEGDLAAA